MKRGLVFLIFIVVLAYSINVQSQINDEEQELFGDNEEINVIVVLKDDYNVLQQYGISNYNFKDDFEMKKMMINEQQEHVLADLKLKNKDKGLSAKANEDYDFDLTNTYTTVNGFAGKLKKSSYQKLRNNPKVVKIYKTKNITLFLNNSAGIINATRVWSLIYSSTNITGKAESICVIDTGVDYTHAALGNCSTTNFTSGVCSKVITGYDFVNSDNDPIDDHGHGTHVTGIVASTDNTYRGIAPDSNIIAIKVLNSAGGGTSANLISGIDWCVNNASIFNISVISMSLGTSTLFTSHCDNDDISLTSSIANAITKNVSVIAATGNADSTTGIASPACITNVTSVGGVDKSDNIDFNRNNITDLLAPGVNILSTKNGGGFETLSGTSMSAPHVAGAFALLRQYRRLEQNQILTPAQIQDALNDTGKQVNDTAGSGFFFSRINVYSALLSLDTIKPGINLVVPTPVNGTNLSLNSTDFFVYINASTNEVLSSSILEISNDTKINASMTINGLNSFINLTSLKLGVISFKIYGNDSAGNFNITDFRIFQINNTAPSILSFTPSNEFVNIVEPNNQTFFINFSDSQNNTVTFFWYLNNSLQLTGVNKNEFNFIGNFTAAGFYVINATLDDGAVISYRSWNLTVNNTNRAVAISSLSPNQTTLEIAEPNNQTFNITYNDPDSGNNITIIWSINGTNKSTTNTISSSSFSSSSGGIGSGGGSGSSASNFTFLGNSTAAGFYNITVIVSDGTDTTPQTWNLTVFNPAPNITSVNLTNTDFLNRTNGTLMAFWSFSDFDNDAITANETLWYINNTSTINYTNKSFIHPLNTTKLENWTFSVRVFDGLNWSDFVNSSTIKILNAKPVLDINTTSIILSETQQVNITLSASDLDNDLLNYTINDSKFFRDSNYFVWNTNLSDAGTYRFNITVNDSIDIDSLIINITINDAKDIDNDGNPDFNDTDKDNDGVGDNIDYLIGNASVINSTIQNLSIVIGNSSNLSQIFNGSLTINFTLNNLTIISFDFNFSKGTDNVSRTLLEKQSQTIVINGKDYLVTANFISSTRAQLIVNSENTGLLNVDDSYTLSDGAKIGVLSITYQDFAGGVHSVDFYIASSVSSTLDLSKLTINRTTNGSSAVSIRGLNLSGTNRTKTVFLEKINTTVKAVCIKDADASFDAISSACDSTSESLLKCDNTTSGQYTCFDTGARYKVTGLNHSAVKEQCRDNDGDGFGEGCAAGNDNCDTDASTSGSCPSGGGSSGGGSSGGGGGGGGGGGSGGGGAFFVCNMDWQCNEWSQCIDGLQTRQCDFVKVPQHASDTPCSSLSITPSTSQKCEISKQLALAAETCEDGIKNQNEIGIDCGGICKPCEGVKNLNAEIAQQTEEAKQPTGFAIKDIVGIVSGKRLVIILITSFIAILVVFAGIKFYKHK